MRGQHLSFMNKFNLQTREHSSYLGGSTTTLLQFDWCRFGSFAEYNNNTFSSVVESKEKNTHQKG